MLSNSFFYLLILFLPSQLGKHFFPTFSFVSGIRIDYLAPTVYLTDLLILATLTSWIVEKLKAQYFPGRKKIKISAKSLIFLIFYLLFFILNIFFAQNKLLAFFKALKIAELTFLAFYITDKKPSFKIAVYFLLFAVFYSSLIAWGQFIKQESINGVFYLLGERTFNLETFGIARAFVLGKLVLRPYATFPHPNVLAGFLTAVLPFVIFLPQIKKEKNKGVFFYFPLLFLTLSTIAISLSKNAWIATILIGAFCLIYFRVKVYKIVLFFLPFLFFLPIFINRLNSAVSSDIETITIREKLVLSSFAMIKKDPLFGVGLNNFIPNLKNTTSINSYQELQPVHNAYLLLTAETGLLGLVFFIFLLRRVFKKMFNKLPFYQSTHLPTCLSFFSILFLSLFDHYFFTLQQAQILFAVICGYIFALQKDKIRE